MIIDCACCAMDHTAACDDCIVTALLASGEAPIELAPAEEAALRNLADAGLVAPLRLVPRWPDEGDAAAG